jgi:exonuclease SbcD
VTADIRILLLADSHLGFDLPLRARVGRRRRGHDFLANYRTALEPARSGEIDVVVHAGDVFNRSAVAPSLAYQALEPLRCIAEQGVPVVIVPGNHERSRIPHVRFASHPRVQVFDTPRTFVVSVRGTRVALAGFPYVRDNVRGRFAEVLEQTRWRETSADVRLLCIHHCLEGATVGPADFTFTSADDVIRARDVPTEFAAVLTGHIHRHQVLTNDLAGRPLATPVLYPGSIERTSIAEIDEPKGFMVVHVDGREPSVRWEFRHLPARPMFHRDVNVDGLSATALEASINAIVVDSPPDAVLSIRVTGELSDEHWRAFSASRLRRIVPDTMNVEIRPDSRFVPRERSRPSAAATPQLSLYEFMTQST